MDWSVYLEAGEPVYWEGRPAPSCFVFRNWKHSLVGLLLLLLSTWWQAVGIQIGRVYGSHLVAWLPLPFVLLGLYLAVGHVLLARYEWERVFYAATDRRLLVKRGILRDRFESLPLAEVTCFQLKALGRELASIRVIAGESRPPLVLCCLEHPRRLTELLQESGARYQESEKLAT